MERQDKKEDKRKISALFKIIIFIILALFCYNIGSSIISGMKKASDEYITEPNSANPN